MVFKAKVWPHVRTSVIYSFFPSTAHESNSSGDLKLKMWMWVLQRFFFLPIILLWNLSFTWDTTRCFFKTPVRPLRSLFFSPPQPLFSFFTPVFCFYWFTQSLRQPWCLWSEATCKQLPLLKSSSIHFCFQRVFVFTPPSHLSLLINSPRVKDNNNEMLSLLLYLDSLVGK